MASRSASGSTKARKAADAKSPNGKGSGRTKASAKSTEWTSRAVIRLIEAGSTAECPHCGERVKFRARHRDQQVICNVYVDGVWNRVEQYHFECYDEADAPYGKPAQK